MKSQSSEADLRGCNLKGQELGPYDGKKKGYSPSFKIQLGCLSGVLPNNKPRMRPYIYILVDIYKIEFDKSMF